MTLRKILVATDFSREAEPAIDAALGLARALSVSVTLLHVCEPPPYSGPRLRSYVPAPEPLEGIVAAAHHRLRDKQARLAANGRDVDVAVAAGAPAGEIMRYATAHDFDLIVVGSHGRRGFRRVILGSVAESVIRAADRPVLTVQARR